MDGGECARYGRARRHDGRGRVRALHQRRKRRARGRIENPERSRADVSGRPAGAPRAVHDALYCSKICSYAQGFSSCARHRRNTMDARLRRNRKIWRGGCIIRARFLQKITEAYERERDAAEPAARSVLSRARSNAARPTGGKRWRRRRRTAFRRLRSHRLSRTTTAIARSASRQTCCRRNGIISGPTRMSASMRRGASSSIWTGPTRIVHSSRLDRSRAAGDNARSKASSPERRTHWRGVQPMLA